MGNIHILQTPNPSRLHYFTANKKGYYLHPNNELVIPKNPNCVNQNIYITSDEDIKKVDWFIRDGSIHKCFRVHKTDIEFLTSIDSVYCGSNTFWSKEFCKKIVLTTDPQLIKDGVQAIRNEFLEWFVNNSNCDEVKIEEKSRCCGRCDGVDDLCYADMTCDDHNTRGCEICYGLRISYKVIIPEEVDWSDLENSGLDKPFKLIEDSGIPKGNLNMLHGENKCVAGCKHFYGGEIKHHKDCFYYPESFSKMYDDLKGKAKKSYSEKEAWNMCNELASYFIGGDTFDLKKWFKQFKK